MADLEQNNTRQNNARQNNGRQNNNVVSLNPGDKASDVVDVAADWIAKMDRGLSAEEEISLQHWMAEATEHRTTLLKMAKLWDNMAALERLKTLFPEPPVAQSGTPQKSYKPLAMAASLAFVGILVAFIYNVSLSQMAPEQQLVVLSQQQIETGTGDAKKVILSDDSELLLNTNSAVNVTYTRSQRAIELLRGEVHVKVAHNPKRPLSVYAGGQIIQAVGTAFNVQLIDEQVELIVTEGKVRVAKQAEATINPLQPENVRLPDSLPALVEGQTSILTLPEIQIDAIAELDIDASLSWQSGNLVFRGESLAQVLSEVSRYNTVSFEVQDKNLYDTQVVGLFKTNDLSGFLRALEQNFAIDNERVDSHKIVLKKRV